MNGKWACLSFHSPAWGLAYAALAAARFPSHFITKKKTKQNTQTICSPASEELLGVRASWTALVLLSCVLSGYQSRGVFLDSSAPREPEARDADLCRKGSPGSIPDLQTRLAARWPRAHDNHFLPGCLPSCARGPSQGGSPTPEPEAVQEGRCCPQ